MSPVHRWTRRRPVVDRDHAMLCSETINNPVIVRVGTFCQLTFTFCDALNLLSCLGERNPCLPDRPCFT